MSTIHFLNVGQGDCCVLQHNSGRVTLVDVCMGNITPLQKLANTIASVDEAASRPRGDFGMSRVPTNPIEYLRALGVRGIHRFVLTHPDMDHLDGLHALFDEFPVENYWDSGVRRNKPEFGGQSRYKEDDWNRYERIIAGREDGLNVVRCRPGMQFKYANKVDEGDKGPDGLHILAPSQDLIESSRNVDDCNDASLALLYRSPGGRIVIPGDAHDETWERITDSYESDVKDCDILFAPHHGRKSGRSFEFLDTLNPRLTLFGCAKAGHLAYGAWSSRKLPVVTNNQAGNIVIESSTGRLDVYVENHSYARACGKDTAVQNAQGYASLGFLPSPTD